MRPVWLMVVMGGVVLAAPPTLLWEGKVTWTLPAATSSLEARLALGGEVWGWRWEGMTSFTEGEWRELKLRASGLAGELSFSAALEWDPQVPPFLGLTAQVKGAPFGLKAEWVGRLEEKGWGWGLRLFGPAGSLVESVRLRFNLKRFLDEVYKDTFVPSFSFGEVRFVARLPCCVERLRGWLLFTKEGFSELGVSFPFPVLQETGLFFAAVMRFKVTEKRDFLAPGLVYRPPACVEAFLGLDWDPTAWRIQGIRVYALGFRCQLEGFSVRVLTMFEDIGLVKRPYKEAVWLGWEGAGCCGPTRFWATLYFGEAGLFGLGEMEVGTEFNFAPHGSVLAEAGFTSEKASLGLGWRVRF